MLVSEQCQVSILSVNSVVKNKFSMNSVGMNTNSVALNA